MRGKIRRGGRGDHFLGGQRRWREIWKRLHFVNSTSYFNQLYRDIRLHEKGVEVRGAVAKSAHIIFTASTVSRQRGVPGHVILRVDTGAVNA